MIPGTYKAIDGQRQVEGLCGDFDGISGNEFYGYGSAQDFGNHWKDRDPCPDIQQPSVPYSPCEVSCLYI